MESLLADLRTARPGTADAELIAAIRRAPDLPEQAIAALLRHHPTLPAFSGSWKFRYGLRRSLAMRQTSKSSPHLRLAAAVILLAIGLPTMVIAGLPAAQLVLNAFAIGLDATGSRSADVALNLFLGAILGFFALAGMAVTGVGLWQLRRYLRQR
ncbi:hypothetical protein CCC_01996 [Paramagnetospirillum magnetotacticum MS-1]|uniref:Uncharacterized protein n=2 Tax=Paramagnetospirillum magnetotacticum TaxID=188 RepID=A0A0C2V0C3_PARME|nr:hypothetical protein CCC_01996 [Paramagnetospirillum magnetotacticum MS-1]